MKIYLCLFGWICLIPHFCVAQRILNVRAQAKGNLVTITYDLLGTISGQLYEVALYSSHNGMSSPLIQVRGDVGPNMKPGVNKMIEWGSLKELNEFDGEVTLEVRATLTFSPMRFNTPKKDAVYRRGKNYKFTWLGGVVNENLQLELYTDTTVRKYEINRVSNKGVYEWEIPINAEPGKNYRLKISSVDKPGNFAFSSNFIIKRKTSTVWKVLPIGIVTGAAIYLILNRDEGTDPIVEDDLPLPPNPR